MDKQSFISIQSTLPNEPGIYKYYGSNGKLIYIGKAKQIRKRISSYFTSKDQSLKTKELVKQIKKIDFTIVPSEHDALLLENALIKQFKPRFNIELKDDKTYPFIVIKNEPFPRVFLTRRKINDGSLYFGPYTSIHAVRDLLELIKQTIPLRTCHLNLSQHAIQKKKYKVCLEYHLGNCKAPCVSNQSTDEYNNGIEQVKHLLRGNLTSIINEYKKVQKELIEELAFEKASLIQHKINALQQYKSKSTVVSPKFGNMDVFAYATEEDIVIISFLVVRNGTIVNSGTNTFKNKADDSIEDILSQGILHVQDTQQDISTTIVLPIPLEFGFETFDLIVPKSGEKKKLLELAQTNATYRIAEVKKRKMLHLSEEQTDKQALLEKTKTALSLNGLPLHIECFDNSNFHGQYPISAMVCFKEGIPSKKDYRFYHVKTVKGINDFATMKEAVLRRYSSLLRDASPLPELVIIDGGKGQLNAAVEAIHELGLQGKMTLIGLAKNIEEIFFYGDKESLKLPYNSEVLMFIRSIRDEVHTFGINQHRRTRSKGTFKNQLLDIEGIGPKTAEELLIHFKSVKNISEASKEELTKIIGTKKAQIVQDFLKK
ncbi:MAG: excinuclease ABC subunit UvrC [Chitinophagaceae bacterium]